MRLGRISLAFDWLLVIGYWLLVIGYWLLVIGYWLLESLFLDNEFPE
jgi:hypothetical protein